MEIQRFNKQAVDVVLTPKDVEIAVIQHIRNSYPEFTEDWLLGAKYNLGSVVIAGTKK